MSLPPIIYIFHSHRRTVTLRHFESIMVKQIDHLDYINCVLFLIEQNINYFLLKIIKIIYILRCKKIITIMLIFCEMHFPQFYGPYSKGL